MARTIFWIALAMTIYVYAGYPLLLIAWGKLSRRSVAKRYHEPSVSLIVTMHNEAASVTSKMENCEELDYPRSKLQVIVSLDAPTDGTEAVLRNCLHEHVEVLSSSVRRGEALALNSGVAHPIFVQFVSHKVGRLLVPYCLAALFFCNALLLASAYGVLFVAQLLWYGKAAAGWLISTHSEMLSGTLPALAKVRSR